MAPVKKEQSGAQKLMGTVGKGCWNFYQAAFKPSIHSFFLWSFVIYVTCGVAVMITRPGVQDLFCKDESITLGQLRDQLSLPASGLGSLSAAERQDVEAKVVTKCSACLSRLLLCPKSACLRTAVNITYKLEAASSTGSLFSEFSEASGQPTCNEIYKMPSVDDPVKLVQQVAASTMIASVKVPCLKFACGVLGMAMLSPDLNHVLGNCSDLQGAKIRDQEKCICSDILTHPNMSQSVTSCGEDLANVRDKLCTVWSDRVGTDNPPKIWPPFCSSTTTTTTTMTTSVSTSTSSTTNTVTARRRLEQDGGGSESLLEEDWDEDRERRLQDATAPSPSPTPTPAVTSVANLPEYIAGPWTPCTCYQQCIPGVQTRTVKCEASVCQLPMPASNTACVCQHCVNCISEPFTLALMIAFFIQAGLALFVFFGYLHYGGGQSEEDFVRLSIRKKCGGFFIRQVPPLIRLLVLAQLFQLVLLVMQVYVARWAGLKDMDECFKSEGLRTVTVICCSFWVLQVIMARFAKTFTRKPDWLYSPDRSGAGFPFKQLKMVLKNLGP